VNYCIDADFAGRRRGGNRKAKVNIEETLRHVISSSLTIACTDSWTEVTIPRSVLEVTMTIFVIILFTFKRNS